MKTVIYVVFLLFSCNIKSCILVVHYCEPNKGGTGLNANCKVEVPPVFVPTYRYADNVIGQSCCCGFSVTLWWTLTDFIAHALINMINYYRWIWWKFIDNNCLKVQRIDSSLERGFDVKQNEAVCNGQWCQNVHTRAHTRCQNQSILRY